MLCVATGFSYAFLSDFYLEFSSALGTADVTLALDTLYPELCFAVFTLNVAVGFAIAEFVFLSYKKVSDRVVNLQIKEIFSASVVQIL